MGIKLEDFPINGIDVSEFNGVIDWNRIKCDFSIIRVGFGRTADAKFHINWLNCKAKKAGYWYMDYYNNHIPGNPNYGLSDAEHGKRQAEVCWELIKADPSMVFLDIESTNGHYAPKIQEVKSRVMVIARAFLERIDELSGRVNGIYCSISLLPWFYVWFINRPVWVAWYNESQTVESVLKQVKLNGWTGACLMWQYASHGDVDSNGTFDGITYFGTTELFMDLNAWTASQADFDKTFGVTTPDDEVIVIPQPEYKTYIVEVGVLSWLNIREQPNTGSPIRGRLLRGAKVNVSNISNGWGKLHGQDLYVSTQYLK